MHGKGSQMALSKSTLKTIIEVPGSDVSIQGIPGWTTKMVEVMKRARAKNVTATTAITDAVVWCEQCAPNTLGGFKVTFNGKLTCTPARMWAFDGKMMVYDKWDFDVEVSPTKFWEQAKKRGFAGQTKTMIGHVALPGKTFEAQGTVGWTESSKSKGKIV
jgi:hypothetical protein